ncbi:MAG: hypothetical protein HUJ26_09450 [Planctomycetaceae bacterium]|nr:hypothetical protein [Planctomycetaceae bacterium]
MDRFQRILIYISCSILLASIGCQQQSTEDYQEFSALPENSEEVESDATTSQEEKDSTEAEKQTASESTKAADSQDDTDVAVEETPIEPLVAVKPVFGQNSGELKTNIDNKTSTSLEAREIKLLVEEPNLRREDGAARVSYDNLDLLKVLNMEPVPADAVSYFPDWLRGLDGEKVRIRGFMYPPFRETGIDFFVLARDNQICCFGRNPKVYDLINVEMRDGVTTNYILNRPFDVVGTFHIRPETDGDEIFGLYEITDAVVIDK